MLRHPTGRPCVQAAIADDTATVADTTARPVVVVKEKGLIGGKIPGEHADYVTLPQSSRQRVGKRVAVAAGDGREIGGSTGAQQVYFLNKPLKKPLPYAVCSTGNTHGMRRRTGQGASARRLAHEQSAPYNSRGTSHSGCHIARGRASR